MICFLKKTMRDYVKIVENPQNSTNFQKVIEKHVVINVIENYV